MKQLKLIVSAIWWLVKTLAEYTFATFCLFCAMLAILFSAPWFIEHWITTLSVIVVISIFVRVAYVEAKKV